MGFIQINSITFIPAPLSAKVVTIKHRLTSLPDIDGNYTTDATNVNVAIDGSLDTPFLITGLNDGTSYTVKIFSNCGGYDAKQAFVTTCNCPDGFTANDYTSPNYCVKTETTGATVLYSDYCLAVSQNGAYTNRKARIYNAGWSNSSIALVTAPTAQVFAEMTASPQWVNTGGISSTTGVMNRNGVWIDSDCNGTKDALAAGAQTTLSFYFNNYDDARTVYVGVGADNQFTLKVNGNTVAQTTVSNSPENFKIWHIFPVDLVVGANFFNVVATGDGTVNDAVAMVVYDNTAAQIRDAATDAALTILFKSSDLIGQHIDIATCPAGYSLDTTGGQGNYICKKITLADCEGLAP